MLYYGFSFYPEHIYDEAQYQKDLELIANSGANVVRMGEFCWDVLEPTEGNYDFSVLERAVNDLGAKGVNTILCTPTACPPAWMMEKYPEIAYVDNRGVRRNHGARHHYCYNNEIYKEYTKKMVENIGAVFGKNPYIIGFQIGNEFGQEGSGRCHCPCCREKFVAGLKEKFGTIENLNQAWGMRFWGQSYTDFSQITLPVAPTERDSLPLHASFFDSPSLRLAFERFASDSVVSYFQFQLEILRNYTDKPLTTNSTGLGTNCVDYYDMFRKADLYGADAYPDLFGEDMSFAAFENAFSRGVKSNAPFWMLEFAIGGGHGLWAGEGRLQPYPGSIENSVMHTFCSGANAVVHFQYKTFCSGAEQLNYALLDQDRIPRRRYFELQKTAESLKAHSAILEGSQVKKAEVAILMDYDSLWALRIKPVKHEHSYVTYAKELHAMLNSLGVNADVISKDADLSCYKVVVVPNLFVLREETAHKLKGYTAQGGTLVGTYLCGVKNEYNVAHSASAPFGLTDVFGACVAEVEPVFPHSVASIAFNGFRGTTHYWIDVLEGLGAEPVGIFSDTYRKGEVLVSKHKYEQGMAYYIGAGFDETTTKKLLDLILTESKVEKAPFALPKNTQVITREMQNGATIYYLFNFNKEQTEILTEQPCINAFTKEPLGAKIALPPKGYLAVTV